MTTRRPSALESSHLRTNTYTYNSPERNEEEDTDMPHQSRTWSKTPITVGLGFTVLAARRLVGREVRMQSAIGYEHGSHANREARGGRPLAWMPRSRARALRWLHENLWCQGRRAAIASTRCPVGAAGGGVRVATIGATRRHLRLCGGCGFGRAAVGVLAAAVTAAAAAAASLVEPRVLRRVLCVLGH